MENLSENDLNFLDNLPAISEENESPEMCLTMQNLNQKTLELLDNFPVVFNLQFIGYTAKQIFDSMEPILTPSFIPDASFSTVLFLKKMNLLNCV